MAINLQTLLEQTLTGLGYELVELQLGHGGLLRVFIDKVDVGVTIDDCVAVSGHLTRLFVVENVEYERLEVSSPGLDRPLVKPADFVRFAGEQVRVKLRYPLPDRRRNFVGKLVGLEEDHVVVTQEVEAGADTLRVPMAQVDRVRLEPQIKVPSRPRKKK